MAPIINITDLRKAFSETESLTKMKTCKKVFPVHPGHRLWIENLIDEKTGDNVWRAWHEASKLNVWEMKNVDKTTFKDSDVLKRCFDDMKAFGKQSMALHKKVGLAGMMARGIFGKKEETPVPEVQESVPASLVVPRKPVSVQEEGTMIKSEIRGYVLGATGGEMPFPDEIAPVIFEIFENPDFAEGNHGQNISDRTFVDALELAIKVLKGKTSLSGNISSITLPVSTTQDAAIVLYFMANDEVISKNIDPIDWVESLVQIVQDVREDIDEENS